MRQAEPAGRGRADYLLAYIGGSGRSGGTILDMMLGSHPQAFSVGAVDRIERWIRRGNFCTCGREIESCPVWSPVLRAGHAGESTPPPAEFRSRSGRRSGMSRRVRSLRALGGGHADAGPSADASWRLLDRVAEVTGRRVLIDSSRNVVRLLALAARPGGRQVRLVQLVRDPRGYVASRTRARPWPTPDGGVATSREVSTPSALLDWLRQNLLIYVLGRSRFRGRYLVVVYEDLVDEPERVLSAVGRLLGIDFVPEMLPPAKAADYHLIAGNSARLSFETLRNDERWRTDLGRREQLVVDLSAGWLYRLLRRQSRRRLAHPSP